MAQRAFLALVAFAVLADGAPRQKDDKDYWSIDPATEEDYSTVSQEWTDQPSTVSQVWTVQPSTQRPPNPPSSSSCACVPKTTWLDISFVVDSSRAMGVGGLAEAVAMVQSTLVQLNLAPSADGMFYTRAAVIVYAADAQVVSDFSNLTSQSDIFAMNPPYLGDSVVNITKAFDVALGVFSRYNDTRRTNAKKVIIVAASAFKEDDYKVVKQFKADGGKVITIDYVQPGQAPIPELANLASPGYVFSNQEQFDFHNMTAAFCDINCFCKDGLLPYSINQNLRGQPNGGCYNPVSLASVQMAGESACTRQKSYLATVHSPDKQRFLMGLWQPKTKYWIGYQRNGGGWSWVDNSTNSFTNWYQPGQPSTGDCVYAQQTSGFLSYWYTAECFTNAYYYACESRPCDSTYNCLV